MDANPFARSLDAAALVHGERPYLMPMADDSVSFAAFRARCLDWAAGLRELGAQFGDRIALLMDNRPEYVEAWYGCQLLGVTVVSLNPMLPGDSQRYLLRMTAPRFCVVALSAPAAQSSAALAAEQVRVIELTGQQTGGITTPGQGSREITPASLESSHPSQIIFTSGTTGRPKGAVQSMAQLTGLLGVAQRIGLSGDDRLMCTAPLYHGLAQAWFQYGLVLGASVVIAPRFSASRFWDDCRRYRVTAIQHVGAVLSFLLRQPPTARDRDHPVRLTFGVGAPLAVWQDFQQRFGVEVVEFYGMTEIGLVAFNDRPARPGSVGRPAGANELRLVGDDGSDVPPGTIGEALTRPSGPGGKRPEYFGDPAATAAAQEDGWFKTGDLLYADHDGYLFFAGRKKESLRRRGENIVPEDIERALLSLPEVEQCAAVGVPSPHGDDDVMLCLVLAVGFGAAGPGHAASNAAGPADFQETVMASLAERICAALPVTMRPSYLTVHDSLPYTSTSKLQRTELRNCPLPRWDVDAGRWLAGSKEATT
jgi:crotonobetaine/carnitine-CoA ligase